MIRAGIGGWTYGSWRGLFFPAGPPHARELEYASRKLATIEVNGTFYRTQTPATFAKWAEDTPDDFVFAVKAPRYATNKRVLAEAGQSIERFVSSGLHELGGKLGPILWQFPATKKFEADGVAAFLRLLPRDLDGRRLRHALEVRHASFLVPEFTEVMREAAEAGAGVGVVLADSEDYPQIEAHGTDFVYVRLMRNRADVSSGYPACELEV